MAASRFVSVTEEVMNAKKRKFSQKSIKDAPIILELIKKKIWSFCYLIKWTYLILEENSLPDEGISR